MIQICSVENCESRGPERGWEKRRLLERGFNVETQMAMETMTDFPSSEGLWKESQSRSYNKEEGACFFVGPCCSLLSEVRGDAL